MFRVFRVKANDNNTAACCSYIKFPNVPVYIHPNVRKQAVGKNKKEERGKV